MTEDDSKHRDDCRLRFELLQSVSLNGSVGKPNDDITATTRSLAWVIDGATDLGPPGLFGTQGGAAWLAGATSAAFTASDAPTMKATCEAAFQRVERQFQRERRRDVEEAWELPKAAFAAARLTGDALEVAWAADCSALHASSESATWCTGAPDSRTEAAEAAALGDGIGADALRAGPVLEDRRKHRGQPDHSALSPHAGASALATQFATYHVTASDDVFLMSDGFTRLVTDFGVYCADTLVDAIRTRGLAALVTELRQIEQADEGCLRYPRFKVSDDATALWLRIAD
ncbi:MAG: hypothetical protein AAFR68_09885 [Pseudomonadota bacterium]